MSQLQKERKVLSIQSHVVFGYVGNKSAVFPLQLLGYDVSFINSVQFSNHTGYKTFNGQVLSGPQLTDLKKGLRDNKLLTKFGALITGYIGSKTFLEEIILLVNELKEINSDLVYVCDPVLGDHGKLYVPKELVQIYIDEVLPLVSILTPNQFELELLTSMKINSEADVKKAFKILHERGIPKLFLTSTEFSFEHDKLHHFFASSRVENGSYHFIKAKFPMIDGRFTGTGDLVASLIFAWTTDCPTNFPLAVKKCLATMQSLLKRTQDSIVSGENEEQELLLIESRFDILTPNEDLHEIFVEEAFLNSNFE